MPPAADPGCHHIWPPPAPSWCILPFRAFLTHDRTHRMVGLEGAPSLQAPAPLGGAPVLPLSITVSCEAADCRALLQASGRSQWPPTIWPTRCGAQPLHQCALGRSSVLRVLSGARGWLRSRQVPNSRRRNASDAAPAAGLLVPNLATNASAPPTPPAAGAHSRGAAAAAPAVDRHPMWRLQPVSGPHKTERDANSLPLGSCASLNLAAPSDPKFAKFYYCAGSWAFP